MNISISEKSKKAYEAACKKLGISNEMPDFSMLRSDIALYMTAKLMLVTIIEADKGGEIFDITNHNVRKYENWFFAEDGHTPGSSGGGFSYGGYERGNVFSYVGARLSFNSSSEGKANAEDYPELWEIVMLDVR